MKVYQAINKVQAALAKEGITKSMRNNQGMGYNFRGIDQVYNALSPLLAEHGLCILPRVVKSEQTERQSAKGGLLIYSYVTMEFDLVSAEDHSKHTICTVGEAFDSGDKSMNKAMSAAYKYAAFQTFAIPTEGDNDADAQTHTLAATSAEAKQNYASSEVAASVKSGNAKEAAHRLSLLSEKELDAVWQQLDQKTQEALTAAWPK